MSTPLAQAFTELQTVYRTLDGADAGNCRTCGRCCWFESAGHRLFATKLEALFLVDKCGPPPRPLTARRCAYQHGRRCRARQGRVLGCRSYLCDQAGGWSSQAHERALREIKVISLAYGVPIEYRELAEHLRAEQGRDAPERRCLQ